MIIKDKCLCQPYVLLHHWSVVHIGEGLIRYRNAKELHSCTDFVWFYFALVFTNINLWMWLIFFVLCCWHTGTLQRGSQPCFTCQTSSLSAGTSLITCPHKIVVAYFAQISCFCRFCGEASWNRATSAFQASKKRTASSWPSSTAPNMPINILIL